MYWLSGDILPKIQLQTVNSTSVFSRITHCAMAGAPATGLLIFFIKKAI